MSAFTVPMFQEQITMQRTAPSKTDGVEIELPDFDEFFRRIQQVSPLSRVAISGETDKGGFSVSEACKLLILPLPPIQVYVLPVIFLVS